MYSSLLLALSLVWSSVCSDEKYALTRSALDVIRATQYCEGYLKMIPSTEMK